MQSNFSPSCITNYTMFWTSLALCEKMTVSSAYRSSLSLTPGELFEGYIGLFLTSFMIASMTRMNRQGLRGQPCLMPVCCLQRSDLQSLDNCTFFASLGLCLGSSTKPLIHGFWLSCIWFCYACPSKMRDPKKQSTIPNLDLIKQTMGRPKNSKEYANAMPN